VPLHLEAFFFILRTGAPWRELPMHYGLWSTVYSQFRRWCLCGVWDVLVVWFGEKTRGGHRPEAMYFATTLRDAKRHSTAQIAALYLRRWEVELFFDDIKTSQSMDTLRCKSPHMVVRELLMHMIAYNLVRHLMMRAEPMRDLHSRGTLSFKGTMDRLDQWQWTIWSAPNRKQARQRREGLLQSIADDEVPPRPGRKEPRVCKDRQNKYTFMTKPRHLYTLQDDLAHAS